MKPVGAVLWFALGMVLVLLFGGCASIGLRGQEMQGLPGEEARDAAALAWASYGERSPLPVVRWVVGDELTCAQQEGGEGRGFDVLLSDGKTHCKGGFTFVDARTADVACSVALHEGERWSQTPLAHELYHAHLARQLRSDAEHKGAGWKPLGDCGPCAYMSPPTCGECGAVDAANEALQRHGL